MGDSKSVLSGVVEHLRGVFGLHLPGLEDLLGQVELVEWRGLRAIKKNFSSEVGLLKWLPPSLFYKSSYPFALSPAERFRRELNFFGMGNGNWYKVPRIYSVDESKLIIIREYIDGRPLTYSHSTCKLLARAMAEVHSRGLVLGDVKPSNFIISDNAIYIIDAEQAISGLSNSDELAGWDLMLTLLFVSYRYVIDSHGFREFVERFLKDYIDSGGSRAGVSSITSLKNLSIGLLMPLYNLVTIMNIVGRIV